MNKYEDPHKKLQDQVDKQVSGKRVVDEKPTSLSPELRKVKDNLLFIKKIAEKPIQKDTHAKRVFGVKLVDPLSIVFGDNIWNRSIFIVDELCDMFNSATIKQRLKYQKQKRKMDSNLSMTIILIIGAVLAVVVLLLVMGVI